MAGLGRGGRGGGAGLCGSRRERRGLRSLGFVAAVVLLWVGRRLFGVWRALRDYEKSETEPRRAYVALLSDPNARVTRPLLGVWSEEPLPKGRLPRAEAVFRCDEERSALMSATGRVVVHEAWVDTGEAVQLPARAGWSRTQASPCRIVALRSAGGTSPR